METGKDIMGNSAEGKDGEMVYVGKNGGEPPERELRIPNQYSGNAFDADGTRRDYVPDAEARRHAEELFRRGYVFGDEALHSESRADGVGSAGESAAGVSGFETAPENRAAEAVTEAVGAAVRKRPAPAGKRSAEAVGRTGFLGGILDKITAEDILLGALILMLYMNGADDELLIMLAILLFC